jgi:hypothetical protein
MEGDNLGGQDPLLGERGPPVLATVSSFAAPTSSGGGGGEREAGGRGEQRQSRWSRAVLAPTHC